MLCPCAIILAMSFLFIFLVFFFLIDQGTRLAAVIEQAQSGEVFDAPEEMGHKVMKFVQGFMGKGK